ncbi:MAG: hypothetical protein WC365_03820 [Candidatus Babeliales bacterium]|jgi:hypothetical protein
MRSYVLSLIALLSVLSLTTSCVKYYDLVKSEFPQGGRLPDQSAVAQRYRREVTLYSEFRTRAVCTALWCADEWRKAYVDVFGAKRGLSAEAREEMLKRQLEENQHWITFYLLADVRDKTFTSLGDSTASWSVYAEVDGKKMPPAPKKEGIKEIELDPEIQLFFGPTFNLFKGAYLIRIPIDPELACRISQRDVRSLKLVVSSSAEYCEMEWTKEQLEDKTKVLKDEDFYWG